MDGDELSGGDLTRMAILALLGRDGPASRATIARELDMSPATVTQVTRRLIEQQLVEPLSFEPSEGGRPGQLIGLIAGAGHAIGVKLALDHLALVDVRLDGTVVATRTDDYDARARSAVEDLIAALETFVRGGGTRLLGIGIGVPGFVGRPDVGDVVADVLGWDQLPLGSHLRRSIGVPVLIENDVKALAVAERLFGLGRSRRSFVVVTIGRGVGFASVSEGVVQRGSHGGAGELGHVVVSSNGPACACGSRGCLEAYVGADGLLSSARDVGAIRSGQGFDRLLAAADRGDAKAREVLARAGQRLGAAVAPAIAALDPEVIIVGGEGTTHWRHWDQAFRRTLVRRLPHALRDVAVEVDEWDDYSWARGAAAIVLATPFDRHAPAGEQRTEVLARLHGT